MPFTASVIASKEISASDVVKHFTWEVGQERYLMISSENMRPYRFYANTSSVAGCAIIRTLTLEKVLMILAADSKVNKQGS